MRVVLLSEFFCKGMGYLENMLPKYLALLGVDTHVVATETATGWIAFDAALYAPFLGYKLFTGNHHHASVFPLATKKVSKWSAESLDSLLKRTAPGKFIAAFTEKCYAISPDCADIA